MRSDAPAAPLDILDVLLSAPAEPALPGQEALARLIRRAAAPAPRPSPVATPAPARPAAAPPAKARPRGRVKTTQYLEADTHVRLALAREALAGLSAVHGRVSKSRVVETALRHALEEFEAKGPRSRLARDLQHPDEA